MDKQERYRATFIGSAIGESLGMPVEGWKREQIQKYVGRITELIDPVVIRDKDGNLIEKDEFGKLKSWTKDLKKGEPTDDLMLTYAIASSIAEKGKLDFLDITKKQIEMYESCIQEDGSIKGAYGKTTMDAFNRIRKGVSPEKAGLFPGLGTGPCMKVSPIGLYLNATKEFRKSLDMADKVGKSTHLDGRAVASGVAQTKAIDSLLRDHSKEDFLKILYEVTFCYEKSLKPETPLREKGYLSSRLKWISQNREISPEWAHQYLGSSSLAIEAYPFTIFMFQKYWDEPLEGLIETVNYGGDCDTTGAMYGALAGAKNGMIFPEKWIKQLNNSQRLIDVADKIYSLKK